VKYDSPRPLKARLERLRANREITAAEDGHSNFRRGAGNLFSPAGRGSASDIVAVVVGKFMNPPLSEQIPSFAERFQSRGSIDRNALRIARRPFSRGGNSSRKAKVQFHHAAVESYNGNGRFARYPSRSIAMQRA